MPDPALSEMIAAPNPSVIPSFQLSPFSIESYAMAEDYFGRRHLEVAAAAAEGATDRIARLIITTANNEIANHRFAFDNPGFRVCAFTDSFLPFLLWLALQPKHPQITQGEAAKMITDANRYQIKIAVVEAMGYKTRKSDEEPPPNAKKGETATSGCSTNPSSMPSSNSTGTASTS
jgi:hypothetical protein